MPRLHLVREPEDAQPTELAGLGVYMVGIGGSGMSGLAQLLRGRGAIVSGSEQKPTEMTRALEGVGIPVQYDQGRGAIPPGTGLVVASAAIKGEHPEIRAARSAGVPVWLYARALGRCMVGRTGVAIAGTHGKSTTTAMLGSSLVDAGLEPSVIVGATYGRLRDGNLGAGGGGGRHGSSAGAGGAGFRIGAGTIPRGPMAGGPGVLVAEACEYNRSFHNLSPTLATITSVEADHLDCYGTLEAVIESFRAFASLLPSAADGGKLLIAHDGAHRREVTAGLSCEVATIGFSPEADYVVGFDPLTRGVTVSRDQKVLGRWTLRVPGAHNATNSASAFVLGTWLGAEGGLLEASLAAFTGADRRSQFLGEREVVGEAGSRGVVRVYDDYGHHPTEVDATLRAMRDFERPQDRGGRLICVFQPHQHSRTRHLLEEFASSFASADVVLVPEIYFVRDSEEDRASVTSADLVSRLVARGVDALHLDPFDRIVEHLERIGRPGDLVVVMGAGPVNEIGLSYVARGAGVRA